MKEPLKKKTPPTVLTLSKEAFKLCGMSYVEAFLLELFLRGDFDTPAAASIQSFIDHLMLTDSNTSTVRNSLRRLLSKGYITNPSTNWQNGFRGKNPPLWKVERDVIQKDIERFRLDNIF